jgi:hypothetical protein
MCPNWRLLCHPLALLEIKHVMYERRSWKLQSGATNPRSFDSINFSYFGMSCVEKERNLHSVRPETLTAMSIKITFFLDATPYSFVDGY